MVTAYILVKANTPEADRLREEIAAVEGVVDVHIVAGDVDLIAKVTVDTPGEVKSIAADALQNIDGIEDTETYLTMD